METNELQELLEMSKAIKTKIRSSKNWDENWLSSVLLRHLSKFDTDIEWYEQEKEFVEKGEPFVLSSYQSDKQSNTTYDSGLTADHFNQPAY